MTTKEKLLIEKTAVLEKELAAKNRELQIEAALEGVRAIALSMKEPADMLEVCTVIATELDKLDVKEIRNVQTAIFYESKGTYMNYEYYAKHNKTIITETSYTNHEIHRAFADQMLKGKGEFFSTHIRRTELPAWIAYQKTTNVFIDDYLQTASSLNYYWFSLGPVALGISSYITLSEEAIDLFKRFLKVFELAYTRYLDIEQAIAQAREAKIEAALEKVRSRSLAVHKSDEFKEVVKIVFEKLQELGIEADAASINIFIESSKDMEVYIGGTNKNGLDIRNFRVLYFDEVISNDRYQAQQSGIDFFSKTYNRGEKNIYFKHQFEFSEIKNIPDDILKKILESEHYSISMALAKHSMIVVNNFEGKLLSDIEIDVLKRFSRVFEQAYVRFLDLQKAEAQAREAKIETALEKVRSRSLAVYKSDEFNEVIKVVFERLQELEIPMTSVSINIIIEGSKDTEAYICGSGEDGLTLSHIRLVYFDHPIANDRYNAYEKGLEFFTNTYNEEEKNSFYEYEFEVSDLKYIPADIKKMVMESKCYTCSAAFTKNSMIVVNDFEGKSLSSEQIDVIKRFAKVFEQAYIRFIDLQKAEAQAREAQIQLALERVRARTMAMQKSDELADVATLLFRQVNDLGIKPWTTGFNIWSDDNNAYEDWIASPAGGFIEPYVIDATAFSEFKALSDAKKSGTDFFILYQEGEILKETYKQLSHFAKNQFEKILDEGFQFPSRQFVHMVFGTKVSLMFITYEPVPGAHDVFKRFGKVFEQTYTRFLDLQKAEMQSREAQIELSLERVRAKTMAMHNSADVGETVAVMFDELVKLGIQTYRCGIGIMHDENKMEVWTAKAGAEGKVDLVIGWLNVSLHPLLQGAFKGWRDKKESYSYELKDNDLINYFNAVNSYAAYPVNYDIASLPKEIFHNDFYFSEGTLFAFSLEKLLEEKKRIFKRFSAVFGQTYRRYLDLKQAEAAAREAQIQLALERVRAKTMAMHSSEDVTSATETMFDELKKLGINNIRGGIANIHPEKTMDVFGITNMIDGKTMKGFTLFDTNEHPIWQRLFESWNNKDEVFIDYLAGQEKEDYINVINSHQNYLPQSIVEFPDTHFQSYRFDQGNIWTYSLQPHSETDREIMKRFASGFALTFRRYQDLKQAEAQAREAQIEAALERVRARTMAMFKSDELAETAVVVFQQLISLGIEPNRLYIGIINDESGDLEFWMTDEEGKQVSKRYIVNIHKNISIKKMYEGWKEQRQTLSVDMQGNELHEWITYWNKEFGVPFMQGAGHQRRVQNLAYFSKGFIATTTFENAPKEIVSLLNRFAAVFNLTYTRFNDLQLAEAQAREATIEAALEKVRGKAMAMHNSNDLSSTASLVFTELRKLGISPIRCGVGLFNKESRKSQLYSATSSPDGDSLSLVGWVMMTEHPVLEKIYESWLNNEEYYPELQGEQLKSYYQLLLRGLPVAMPDIDAAKKQYGHFLPFSIGCLNTWSDHPHSESEIKILRRFATIIDLTFRRYLELQKSEANAREAVKQAAVDRIRADIASMRTISDLDRITPLIWNELTILGINFIRCGVFIMDDSQQLIHTFLSTPDGKAIAAFHLPYSTPGNIQKVISHWHDDKNYIDHWDESDFTQFAEILVQQKALSSAEEYLKTIPHDGFYLHFLPFLQGMLYVGNTNQLNEEEINLIQSVADAFSTAYARYEDFNKLEAAKQQVEKTLTELKQTQQQLVQAEKMASLGELTAGIAHEIQNPLNFVNNFSEVNKEMLEELRAECLKPNAERDESLETDIINDVIANEEKINHHGKRADAIVKSMLQHSRKTSGQREPTDINALCDEYLRLSYHGLRAKDKSFNANFKTDFDETIGKIDIVPQDIGRVLLNLFNNAFYTTNEKFTASRSPLTDDYKPIVTVQTKKINGNVEIKVSDNGNGISQNVIDKIFQPFFTTKPTGQGTGLGLSLAYDIITKEHSGTIKVESKEGEGSEFIIQLPI